MKIYFHFLSLKLLNDCLFFVIGFRVYLQLTPLPVYDCLFAFGQTGAYFPATLRVRIMFRRFEAVPSVQRRLLVVFVVGGAADCRWIVRAAQAKVYKPRATKFCTVAPNIFESSVWNLLHTTLLAPGILRWVLSLGRCSQCFKG
jgi:hypothetical protein